MFSGVSATGFRVKRAMSGTGGVGMFGATVNASFAPGTYVAKQYTILNAGVALHDRFSSLVSTNLPSGFHASLSYGTDDVYLRQPHELQSDERQERDVRRAR